jgi:hypothetical protein
VIVCPRLNLAGIYYRSTVKEEIMAVNIIMKNHAKRELIRKIALTWIKKDPAGAREAAEAVKEFTKLDLHKNGKTKQDTGYISVRMPSELWQILRHFIPSFGDDDRDIKLLSAEFPDLILCRK